MKTALEALMTGLDEVEAFLAGERKGLEVHVPDRMADRQSKPRAPHQTLIDLIRDRLKRLKEMLR